MALSAMARSNSLRRVATASSGTWSKIACQSGCLTNSALMLVASAVEMNCLPPELITCAVWPWVWPCAGIDQHEPAGGLDREHGEGDWHEGVGQTGRLELGLGLIDGRTLDEVVVVRLFPDAVVERNHLDVADLILLETRPRRQCLRLRGADEGQRFVEAERCESAGHPDDEVSA